MEQYVELYKATEQELLLALKEIDGVGCKWSGNTFTYSLESKNIHLVVGEDFNWAVFDELLIGESDMGIVALNYYVSLLLPKANKTIPIVNNDDFMHKRSPDDVRLAQSAEQLYQSIKFKEWNFNIAPLKHDENSKTNKTSFDFTNMDEFNDLRLPEPTKDLMSKWHDLCCGHMSECQEGVTVATPSGEEFLVTDIVSKSVGADEDRSWAVEVDIKLGQDIKGLYPDNTDSYNRRCLGKPDSVSKVSSVPKLMVIDSISSTVPYNKQASEQPTDIIIPLEERFIIPTPTPTTKLSQFIEMLKRSSIDKECLRFTDSNERYSILVTKFTPRHLLLELLKVLDDRDDPCSSITQTKYPFGEYYINRGVLSGKNNRLRVIMSDFGDGFLDEELSDLINDKRRYEQYTPVPCTITHSLQDDRESLTFSDGSLHPITGECSFINYTSLMQNIVDSVEGEYE